MPIVDIANPGLYSPMDTPKGFAVTPGEDDLNHGSEKPDGSILGAAFRQDNTVGAMIAREYDTAVETPEEGFNAWDKIKGTKYEHRWESFVDTKNTRALTGMQRQIDRETADRRLLDSAPWYASFPAQMAAGVLDLPTLIPGGAFLRGAKGGFSVGKSALMVGTAAGGSTALQEYGLQQLNETRTGLESGINIGASVFLGGLLGAGGAKLLSNAEWNGAVNALERELAGTGTTANAAKPVYDDVVTQLRAAGFDETKAQANAAVIAANYATLAQRTGGDAMELYKGEGLTIARTGGEVTGLGDSTFEQGAKYPIAPRSEWYGDANFESTGGRMTTMTPDEFLASSRPLVVDDVSRENIDLLKQHINEGKTLDPLALYGNGKEDGRHRAIAAQELGIERVPVIDFRSSERTFEQAAKMPDLPPPPKVAGRDGLTNPLPSPPDWSQKLTRALSRKENVGAPNNDAIELEPGVFVGKVNLDQWIQRTDHNLTPEEIAGARRWYSEALTVYEQYFGKEKAPAMLGAWLTANVNATPSFAQLSATRTLEQYLNKTGAFAPNKKGGLAHDKLIQYWDAIMSNDLSKLGRGGSGQKIYDFIDSALLKTTRTFYGDDPRAGAPAVADVHSLRDVGFVDEATLNWVKEKYGEDVAAKLSRDSEGLSPGEAQYEWSADKMRDWTEELNARGYQGGNWTPLELQAVGWTSMSKMLGRKAENSTSAIEANIRNLSYELDFGEGAPYHQQFSEWNGLTPDQKATVSKAVLPLIVDEAKSIAGAHEFARVTGLGGWHQFTNESFKSRLIASPEVATDVANIIGYLAQQTKVFGYRWETSGNKLGIALYGEGLSDPAKVAKMWDVLVERHPDFAAGFSPSVNAAGEKGIEIILDKGGAKMAARIQDELVPALEKIAKELDLDGIKVQDFRAGEASSGHDWKADVSGAGYLHGLSARYGPAISERLELFKREKLEPALRDEIGRYAGPAERPAGAGGIGESRLAAGAQLLQGEAAEPLGRVTLNEGQALVELFSKANESTLMHEAGHIWLAQLVRFANKADAPQSMKDDLAKTLKWFGVDDASKITREHHEQWARGFEQYLATGKAPSAQLQSVFQQFKEWLTAIYKSLTELGHPIPDEIRGVFDRMLATDAEIAAARGGPSGMGSVGAAAALPASLEDNAIAGKAASAVAAATAMLNPALRLLQSTSAVARDVSIKLFENSLYLKKNFDGVASEVAVETLMKEWNGGLAKALSATDEAFSAYKKGGGKLSRTEFREAVGKAMRRGDDDPDPFVTKVAQSWRAQVFEPLKLAAIEAKLLPPDVTVETAASYFSRMWNRNKLVAKEGEFKGVVMAWIDREAPKWMHIYDKETIAKSAKLEGDKLRDYQVERRIEREARFGDLRESSRQTADEIFDTLTGKTTDSVRPENVTVKARGPLKERTFNIPDELVEQFLEHDVAAVGRRYTRVMGADTEIASKFGSVDMADQIAKVKEDYAKLRAEAKNEKAAMKLDDAETRDVGDIEALRDILRGQSIYNPYLNGVERNYGRLVRGANHLNYIRSMGEVVLASLTDAVRPAMVHGLGQFMATLPQLAFNMRAVKMSVAEAQLAGNVAERVLQHRLATLSEIADPYASRGPVEAFMENMTNFASRWNGIRMWTDMMKSVASVMTQNRILQNVTDFAKINGKEKSYLAYLGIDESMADRIAKQFAAHGENIEGVRVANTEAWTDRVAMRTYRAAMNKDVDSIVVQKGVADIPLFANTPTGKALLQFKSFALASHQRILLRGLQEDSTRFVGGTLAMTGMGMFITYMKAVSGNRPETQEKALSNPGWWIGEGLDRSGIFAVPMELANVFEKGTGLNPMKSPIRVWDESGGISQKMQNRNKVGSLLGPTIGLGEDVMTAAGIPSSIMKGEEVTKGQRSAVESLLPFNSYMGVRQMIRHFVRADE
jgi:hypothetical protein